MIRLFVDADGCPVRGETLRVAERHGLQVYLVCNGGLRPSQHPLVESVFVSEGPDAADRWIAERIGPSDICVTADIPLAARCIEAGAQVVRHTGEPLTAANIGSVLAMRDLMADLRAANPLEMRGGGRPFAKADRSRFLDQLERAVQAGKRG